MSFDRGAVCFEQGFNIAWEFMWRRFSTCHVETFSTPVFADGPASAECRRGTQSACATLSFRPSAFICGQVCFGPY